jgi:hypothetical protein
VGRELNSYKMNVFDEITKHLWGHWSLIVRSGWVMLVWCLEYIALFVLSFCMFSMGYHFAHRLATRSWGMS